jgi:hypothetical protein
MMSNKEFLELLNLYIDQEISPEDREILEREIGSNESRLAMFNEYVRLQQATEKLFNHFRDNLTETVDLKKYQILSRDSQQRLVLGSLYSAAAVLVACMSIFAATRILSDPMGASQAHAIDSEAALDRIDVEVIAEGGLQRGDRGFLYGTGAGSVLPASMAWAFADFPDFPESFGAGVEREVFSRNGNRVFQSTSPFESPSPDHVSFQFQR